MTSFRDATVVVLEISRDTIRAGYGLAELMPRPSVHVTARVALPKGATGPFKANDYLAGSTLDDALAAGQALDVSYPFIDGTIRDWVQAEALWKHVCLRKLGLKRAQNESPVMLNVFPGLSRADHEELSRIFFERLNFAAVSIVERPMAQIYAVGALTGVVVDVNRVHTEVTPVYDGLPVLSARTLLPIGADDCERFLAQVLRQNTAVMAALSATPPERMQDTLLTLARQTWRDGLVRIAETSTSPEDEGVTDIAAVLVAGKEKAVIESGMKKRANAKATAAELARAREIEALDLVKIQFQGQELTLGKERHRFCDPLFHPALLQGIPEPADCIVTLEERRTKAKVPAHFPSLSEVIGHAISLAEVDQRRYIYENLFVTGEMCSHVKGLGHALQARLTSFLIGNPDQQNEIQPRTVGVLKVPDYFFEYREVGDGYAAFLGGSIVAKLSFNDPNSRNFVSKTDYAAKGPRAIIQMSSALL